MDEATKKYLDEKFATIFKKAAAPPKATYNLTSKGNQSQVDHQLKLIDFLNKIKENVEDNEGEEALATIKEAKESVEKRMKLIRLADKSEYGWATVAEYESDELASDSDDEKKMRRAEAAAGQKRKRQQQARINKAAKSESSSEGTSSRGNLFRANQGKNICFACGEQGHWRRQCPGAKTGKLDTSDTAAKSTVPPAKNE